MVILNYESNIKIYDVSGRNSEGDGSYGNNINNFN